MDPVRTSEKAACAAPLSMYSSNVTATVASTATPAGALAGAVASILGALTSEAAAPAQTSGP